MAKKKTKQQVVVYNQPATAKTARNQRKRQRKRANRSALAQSAGSSMRGMAGRWPTTRDGGAFLRAALDPFSDQTLPQVGVPDAFAGETLKHKNTMEITAIADGNGVLTLAIIPSASTPIIALNGTFKNVLMPTVDAATHAANGTVTRDINASTLSTAGTLPGICWPYWAKNYGSSGSIFGPFDYKSQRVVSMGLEWRYTGTELSDQGVATAAIVDAYMIPGYTDYTRAGAVSDQVRFVERGDVITLWNITQTSLSNQPQYRQLTMHSAEGAGGMLVLVSGEDGYVMSPTIPSTGIVEAAGVTAAYMGGSFISVGTYGEESATVGNPAWFPLIPWQNLRPIGLTFTGLAANQPIVFKLVQRVEASVNPASVFAQFTGRSPSEDSQALCTVANIQKTIPVMVPVTMNSFGDWWRKIMRTIGGVGKVVGSIGIPFASPIASAVGGLADVLGSL